MPEEDKDGKESSIDIDLDALEDDDEDVTIEKDEDFDVGADQQQTRLPTVALGIPFAGNPSPEWSVALSRLAKPEGTRFITETKGTIDYAREDIVETFLNQTDNDYLFFIDSDVILPQNALVHLLQRGLDIVSGLYISKKDPLVTNSGNAIRYPAAWKYYEEDGLQPVVDWPESGGLIKVDAVGLGFCLISRRLLNQISKPRFKWTKGLTDKDHPWSELSDATGVGEDFWFCYKLQQETDAQIYLDVNIEGKHEVPGTLHRHGIEQTEI